MGSKARKVRTETQLGMSEEKKSKESKNGRSGGKDRREKEQGMLDEK